MKKNTRPTLKQFPKKPSNLKKPTKLKKTWESDKPTGSERIKLFGKCKKCILVPPKANADKKDPKNYKFPICTKLSKTKGKCQYNCPGIVAANRRARLTKKYPGIVKLTANLIKKWKCTKKAQMEDQKKKKKVAPKKKKISVTKKSPSLRKKTLSKPKTTTSKKMSWPKYFAKQTKGRTFKSRTDINNHMRVLAVEYKKKMK